MRRVAADSSLRTLVVFATSFGRARFSPVTKSLHNLTDLSRWTGLFFVPSGHKGQGFFPEKYDHRA